MYLVNFSLGNEISKITVMKKLFVTMVLGMSVFAGASAETAGTPSKSDLVISRDKTSKAIVVVSPDAKPGLKSPTRFEFQAANDLVKYIELISGARPQFANTSESVKAALENKTDPILLVGSIAIQHNNEIAETLRNTAKKNPILRSDAISLQRRGNRVYLAGLTDDGHYHAVAELLERWGCRWYMPTEFGECIPEHNELTIGELDYAYASPFELRSYWLAWNGSNEGKDDFAIRNRNSLGLSVRMGHSLGNYVKDLVPPGKTLFNVPIAEDMTAEHVAKQLEPIFKGGCISSGDVRPIPVVNVSLAMDDGIYVSDSKLDKELQANFRDKYFLNQATTDSFMTFYNKVSRILLGKYPDSKCRIGFLAYCNMTIPPQRVTRAEKPLFCALAPIDIDPNHGMDDMRAPSRQEYKEMMYRWSEIMEKRIWIYDYDQGMLVWRDLPNPSHHVFCQDVKHYVKAGVLGVNTESRGATATTFLNLYFRSQLMWDPQFDVNKALKEFYPRFYGPAAEAMEKYWSAIYKAWADTLSVEHEFFVAPAVYTPELVEYLRKNLADGLTAAEKLRRKKRLTRNEELYLQRMEFTRLSFEIIDKYTAMITAGATHCDYVTAEKAGKVALAARMTLAKMNPTFCTRVVGIASEPEYGGAPAWFPGEVKLYGDFNNLIDGTNGKLVNLLPLEWAFRRDVNDSGLPSGWAYREADLNFWTANNHKFTGFNRKNYPGSEWEMLRTDLYSQGQGILDSDGQAYTGISYYKTSVSFSAQEAKRQIHIFFPGLFGECWLYVNGQLQAYRAQNHMWWYNSYSFTWDADITGALREGRNDITLRVLSTHHISGMFRRPLLYEPVKKEVSNGKK